VLKYLRQGIYRQELAALVLLAEEREAPLSDLARELRDAGSFSALAVKRKADALKLFAAGGELKSAIDSRMPLFLAVGVSTAPPAGAPPGEAETGKGAEK